MCFAHFYFSLLSYLCLSTRTSKIEDEICFLINVTEGNCCFIITSYIFIYTCLDIIFIFTKSNTFVGHYSANQKVRFYRVLFVSE